MLEADIGEYANHVFKGLEKGRSVYQFLVAFFILQYSFLNFHPLPLL